MYAYAAVNRPKRWFTGVKLTKKQAEGTRCRIIRLVRVIMGGMQHNGLYEADNLYLWAAKAGR